MYFDTGSCMCLMQFYLQPANRICEKKAILSLMVTEFSRVQANLQ